MQPSERFFANKACKYYPCHVGMEGRELNCLFCYCPMNPYPDCPGNPTYKTCADGSRIKVCTDCTFPHQPENYDAVIEFLKGKMYRRD